MQVQKVMKM